MFEAHFQSFEDRSASGDSASRLAALAGGAETARARRLHRAARRPLPERICAALRRAARLAHRLHRLGRRRHRARRPRRACSSTAAIRCRRATKWTPPLLPSNIWSSIRRRSGSKRICRPAPSSAIRRGCTPSTAPSGSPKPARRPARSLVAVADNPIDACWQARPAPPLGAVVLHDLRYAGEDAAAKLARVRAELAKLSAERLGGVRSASGVLAVQHPRQRRAAYAGGAGLRLVPKEGRPSLYIDGRKLGNDVRHRLEELAAVRAPEDFEARSRRAR